MIIDDALSFEQFLKNKCNSINPSLYQLGKMRKYITSDIACTIYKQTILPLYDYGDFVVDCGPKYYIKKLDALHEKGLKLIDCKMHHNADIALLQSHYRIIPPQLRRREHLYVVMYRLSKFGDNLEKYRPKIHLRSRKKVKFKSQRRNLEKVLKSPFSRGVKLWDQIPENIQRALTKVKFKAALRRQLGISVYESLLLTH